MIYGHLAFQEFFRAKTLPENAVGCLALKLVHYSGIKLRMRSLTNVLHLLPEFSMYSK
jgi:hypothetical protein